MTRGGSQASDSSSLRESRREHCERNASISGPAAVASFGLSMVAAIAITACGGWDASTEIPRAPAQRHTEAPEELWLFADPQLNNVAGARTRSRTELLDNYAEHAIRPPSVDLWSGHLLAAAVKQMRDDPRPAFFLGDAANTSCVGEMLRFLKEVDGLLWFGVLGNHDGYYMGNLTFAADAIENPADFTWQGACEYAGLGSTLLRSRLGQLERQLLGQKNSNAEQGTMTKAVAIWLFLADLHRRAGLSRDPLDPRSWTADGDYRVYDAQGSYELGGRSLAVRAFAAVRASGVRSDVRSRSWQGYLLQDVELPGGDHVLLLDTSDYEHQPPSSRWSQFFDTIFNPRRMPGRWGRVGEHQASKARAMQQDHSRRFFVMGHHHWRRIDGSDSNASLKALLSDPHFATYISGHTHSPTASMATSTDEQWELNVASVTDWPMQLARLAYWGGTGHVDMRVRTLPVVSTPGVCGYSTEAADEMDYGTVDKYVYRSLTVYKHVLDYAVSLRRHVRAQEYLDKVKTAVRSGVSEDDRRKALSEVIEYDQVVLRLDPDIVRVETDCAIWASNLEGKKGEPRARPGDEISSGAEFRVRTNPFRPVHAPVLDGWSP